MDIYSFQSPKRIPGVTGKGTTYKLFGNESCFQIFPLFIRFQLLRVINAYDNTKNQWTQSTNSNAPTNTSNILPLRTPLASTIDTLSLGLHRLLVSQSSFGKAIFIHYPYNEEHNHQAKTDEPTISTPFGGVWRLWIEFTDCFCVRSTTATISCIYN